MRIGRREFIAVAAATSAMAAPTIIRRAKADAQFVAKLNCPAPEADPQVQGMRKLSDAVKQKTDGAVDLQIFPNGQLGKDVRILSAMKTGAVEACCMLGSEAAQYVPLMNVCDLPFLFRDADHGQKASSAIQETLRGSMSDAGFYLLGMFNDGDKDVCSTEPITKLSDVTGKKIRISESTTMLDTWKALGANPTPVPSVEVYMALQTKVVDAVDNTATSYITFKRYEVAHHFTKSHHGQGICLVAFSNHWIEQLPKQYLSALDEAANEVLPVVYADYMSAENAVFDKAGELGFTCYDIADRDAWVAATASVRDGFGAQSDVSRKMLDKIESIA